MGTGTLAGAVSDQRGLHTLLPPPYSLLTPSGANPSLVSSPAPRSGHGRHWAPQPRPWRQQQSSKVRVGPARAPAHMPSSPRWVQHTSRRSGARSAEGNPVSERGAGSKDCPSCPFVPQPTLTRAATPGLHTQNRTLQLAGGRPKPSPAGLSGSWQSRPEGPGTQGGRHSQR